MINAGRTKQLLRKVLQGMVGLLAAVVLFAVVAYAIVVSRHHKIAALTSALIAEQTGASVFISDYHVGVFEKLSLVSLTFDDIVLRDSAYGHHGQELLRVKNASIQFRPLKLLFRKFAIKAIKVDNAHLRLYRSADGYMNTQFLHSDTSRTSGQERRPDPLFLIDYLDFRNFTIDYIDSLRGKHHSVRMEKTRFYLDQKPEADFIQASGAWFFKGLTFKMKNGPFLHNKKAFVDLRVKLNRGTGRVDFLPSTLEVEQETFHLDGHLLSGDPPYLKVRIKHPGILLKDARKVLADNLRHTLEKYDIDRPIRTEVVVEGYMFPGEALPADVSFSFQEANVAFDAIRLSNTSLSGQYYNCDPDGKVNPHSGCLEIDTLSGNLFGAVPLSGHLLLEDLADPLMTLEVRTDTLLKEWNPLFSAAPFRFGPGRGEIALRFQGKPGEWNKSAPDLRYFDMDGHLRISRGGLVFPGSSMKIHAINAYCRFDETDLFMQDFNLAINGNDYHLQGTFNDFFPFLLKADQSLTAQVIASADMVNFDHFFPPPGEKKIQVKKAIKPGRDSTMISTIASTIERMTRQIALNLEVSGQAIKYRDFSASNLFFEAELLGNCGREFSGACLRFNNFTADLYESVPLEAQMTVTHLDNPFLTVDGEIKVPLSTLNRWLPPEKLQVEKGRADVIFHYEGSLQDYVNLEKAASNAILLGQVILVDASVDYLPKNYRIQRLSGLLRFDEKDLVIDSLHLFFNDQQVEIQGRLTDFVPFTLVEDRQLHAAIDVSSPRLDFTNFTEVPVAKPVAGKVNFEQNRITEIVEAAFEQGSAELSVQADKLIYHGFSADSVTFASSFPNVCYTRRSTGEECFVIENFSGKVFGNAPFRSSFRVLNPQDPFFIADASIDMPLVNLNRMFPANKFQFNNGGINVDFHYEGQLYNSLNVDEMLIEGAIGGEVVLSDASFDYIPKGYFLRELNGKFTFDQEDLHIEHLSLLLNDNEIEAKGQIQKLLPFLFLPERKLTSTLELYSPRFQFDNFKAPKKYRDKVEKLPFGHTPTAVTRVVDSLLANLEVNFALGIDEVLYRKFRGLNAAGQLTMSPERVRFEEVRMEMAGGDFHLQGDISGLEKNQPLINIQTGFDNAEVARIFYAFDNFGQQQITSGNIGGNMTAHFSFQASANSNYDLLPATIKATVNLKIENGELINLPFLTNMNSFLLKNRNMAHVKFATLENRFKMEGTELHIDDFFVASSIFTFAVKGQYCLGDGSHTSLLFQVPVANLFRKNLPVSVLEEWKSNRDGKYIMLRAKEKEDKLRVRPVLFGSY